jgi:hypothetical protein
MTVGEGIERPFTYRKTVIWLQAHTGMLGQSKAHYWSLGAVLVVSIKLNRKEGATGIRKCLEAIKSIASMPAKHAGEKVLISDWRLKKPVLMRVVTWQ